MKFFTLLLLLTALCCPVMSMYSVWCVYEEENLCNNCSQHLNSSHIVENTTIVKESNVQFTFCSSVVTFNEVVIKFLDSAILKIHSFTGFTEVHCTSESGLYIANSTDVAMESMSFINCGTDILSHHLEQPTRASMLIEDSLNVRLENIHFHDSTGSALVMIDNNGTISVRDCSFTNSTPRHTNNTTVGAVVVAMSISKWKSLHDIVKQKNYIIWNEGDDDYNPVTNCTVTVSGCNFTNNGPVADNKVSGGGLSVIILQKSSNNYVTISYCLFADNSALYYGGGLHIIIMQAPHGNQILIENSSFKSNTCFLRSGGGVAIEVLAYNETFLPKGNQIQFSGCEFSDNQAKIGGAVSVYLSQSPEHRMEVNKKSIKFLNCTCLNNNATLGAAVDLVQSTALHAREAVEFTDCAFVANNLQFSQINTGVVFARNYPLYFNSTVTFSANTGSALYLAPANMILEPHSTIRFESNNGVNGGALQIIGESIIVIKRGSLLIFSNNIACKGAAINQQSTNPQDKIFSTACFIRYAEEKEAKLVESHFVFENNSGAATCASWGDSVHVTTLSPCLHKYKQYGCLKRKGSARYGCIADLIFGVNNNDSREVSTGVKWIVKTSHSLTAIPGIEANIPVSSVDEFGEAIPGIYTVLLKEQQGDITLDSAYNVVSNNKTKLYGTPGSTATLLLSTDNIHKQIPVVLQQCPPGYVNEGRNNSKMCTCSISAKPSDQYQCIVDCSDTDNIAFLKRNYWFGYDNSLCGHAGNSSQLLYSYCPRGYCSTSKLATPLTNDTRCSKLSEIVCNENRRGILCGQCKAGYSTHFHSNTHECLASKTCDYGWFLYILSELVPITALFVVINVFDIKLTGGAINGFIYFAQIVNLIVVDTKHFEYTGIVGVLIDMHRTIVHVFHLNFFQFNSFSFCLWKEAQAMDVLMFRYVGTLYALILVIIIVITMRNVRVKKFVRRIRRNELATASGTLIHGITGFLVLSYFDFINSSIKLLIPVTLHSKGHHPVYRAVWHNGELPYFGRGHLYYAIPSLIVLATFGLVPPLLLVSYPLCYRVLALLKLSESKFSSFMCKCLPLEKMKPLFDSFQSSFKDKYRFFSGLYFAYRLIILSLQGISDDVPNFYAGLQIMSSLVFAVHVICQPYKKKVHNVIEGLFFLDIALLAMTFTAAQPPNVFIITLQILLLYFPLVFLAVYLGRSIWKVVRAYRRKIRRKTPEDATLYHEFTDNSLIAAVESRDDST